MDIKELKPLLWGVGIFVLFYFLPIGGETFDTAVLAALELARWYAREHVLLCLIPAFFIAGGIAVFLSPQSVMKYLGAGARRSVAYLVASVSGSVLAVCSCTILPLFAGIYRMGAGLGPATAFLYAGPAINVLAIILTARILGAELGIARAVGAVIFSIVIGLLMQFIFRNEKQQAAPAMADLPDEETRSTTQNILWFGAMVGILVFANWSQPQTESGLWYHIYQWKWIVTSSLGLGLAAMLWRWFKVPVSHVIGVIIPVAALALIFPRTPAIAFITAIGGLVVITLTTSDVTRNWTTSSWEFTKQIVPLLFSGVLIAGLLMGSPESKGLIPQQWISNLVGGNSIFANLFASVAGALMYFATLTEIPILEGLIAGGMGKGPALALLLAGPAVSLPNMLVINSVLGARKTTVFVLLVIVMATMSGMVYGAW